MQLGSNEAFSRILIDKTLEENGWNLLITRHRVAFLKWFIDHLASNGRTGVILPNGVLFGSSDVATKLRQLLLTKVKELWLGNGIKEEARRARRDRSLRGDG